MKKSLLALLCAGVASAQAGIDFKTQVTETTTPMGFKAQYYSFSEKGRSITYVAPRGWTHSGGGASISFTPPGLNQARADIEQAPLPAPQEMNDEMRTALRDRTMAAVPPDSQNVTVVSETSNPVVLNQNQSHEVVISYQAFGQEFMMGIIYLNMPDTQLRFRTIARKADFDGVHSQFRRSLFTLQWK